MAMVVAVLEGMGMAVVVVMGVAVLLSVVLMAMLVFVSMLVVVAVRVAVMTVAHGYPPRCDERVNWL